MSFFLPPVARQHISSVIDEILRKQFRAWLFVSFHWTTSGWQAETKARRGLFSSSVTELTALFDRSNRATKTNFSSPRRSVMQASHSSQLLARTHTPSTIRDREPTTCPLTLPYPCRHNHDRNAVVAILVRNSVTAAANHFV